MVSYPLTSKQRKLLASDSMGRKTAIAHLKWLQKPSDRPSFIVNSGRKTYNISTGEMIVSKSKKVENPDPQAI